MSDVASHNTAKDLWVVYDGKVYDLSAFVHQHPGGSAILVKQAGRDMTAAFDAQHGPIERSMLQMYYIGDLGSALVASPSPKTPSQSTFLNPGITSPSPQTVGSIHPEPITSPVGSDGYLCSAARTMPVVFAIIPLLV